MKVRSAAVQGALAVAGLVAAYVTWQRPAEESDAEAVVLDVGRSALERIRYEDRKRVVEVVPARDGTWIRQTEKPPPPPAPTPPPDATAHADAGTGAEAASPPEPPPEPPTPAEPPKPREYKANETADRLLERFTPLRAVRALGVLPEAKLAELGLDDSDRVLEVTARGTTTRFRLSTGGQGSGASSYARREDDGRVYLLRGTTLSDLEFAASRLVDRRLHAFRDDEYDGVRLLAGGKQRQLARVGDKLAVSPGGAVDDFASNWHDRLWRLVGVDVLGRGEDPAAGAPQVEVKVEYLRGARTVGFIELGRAGTDIFARTEHTAGWVRLHGGAEQLLAEGDQLVGSG